ncbi:hypothetical protein GUJ93_ZPchr0002g23681 [Zizania palustris]|uniref:Uncharacterized protein n=1 Tax=Zizania palustris TaxID=103762 RepID=A0A8J5V3W8_ZIZPA|nr:hypothetical protein GUJ93_ZPchr0002g23681 [Zizania palustris]
MFNVLRIWNSEIEQEEGEVHVSATSTQRKQRLCRIVVFLPKINVVKHLVKPQSPFRRSPPCVCSDWILASMNPSGAGAGDLPSIRCPKHPSHPPFTGFCSACLLERLSAARFPSPSPSLIAAEISTEIAQPRVRTTLLYLFQLDDTASPAGAQDEQGQGRPLQRKRSLRQSCEWIVCCDTGADSRQSWDGSAGAPNASSSDGALVSKPIAAFVSRPTQMLRRSLSESWRHARGDAARSGVSMNGGSRSVSSAGMDSEISLADSIHADAQNAAPRQSLLRRFCRLGRSRSVHCSSTQLRSLDFGMLRFHLTPLSRSSSSSRHGISNKIQGRRISLFANQRQEL